jgi:hypothetical protein
MKIRLFAPVDIDRERYDRCILDAPNGVVYALSWYLDVVAPGWQLLATDDYSFVMPLPLKRKLGLPYVLQPSMSQQLGVFSTEVVSEAIVRCFLRKIPAVYCMLQLNAGNVLDGKEWRPNYVLDIRSSYEIIRRAYHRNTHAGLKKADRARLLFDRMEDPASVLELLRSQSIHYSEKEVDVMWKLSVQAQDRDVLYVRCVWDEAGVELLAGVLFFRWKDRFYYLTPVSSSAGRAIGAMRFLIDRFVAEFAGQWFRIDFEGSAVPSVAQFYRNFGAVAEWYPVYRNGGARILRGLRGVWVDDLRL